MSSKFCKANPNECAVFHKVCTTFPYKFTPKYSKIECFLSFPDSKSKNYPKTNHLPQLPDGYYFQDISDFVSKCKHL